MEYNNLDDTYASGLGQLSRVSRDTLRLVFYAQHQDDDGRVENRPVCNLVMGQSDFATLVNFMTAALTFDEKPIGEAGRELAN
jgi:hypothetical protein